MGHQTKWEYLRAIYERYRKAGRRSKQVILNEFCLNTGYNRKYAICLLNGPPPGKQPTRRPQRRGLSYGHQVLSILTAIWEAAGYEFDRRADLSGRLAEAGAAAPAVAAQSGLSGAGRQHPRAALPNAEHGEVLPAPRGVRVRPDAERGTGRRTAERYASACAFRCPASRLLPGGFHRRAFQEYLCRDIRRGLQPSCQSH